MNLALSIAETLEIVAQGADQPLTEKWADVFGVGIDTPDYFTALTVLYARLRELRERILDSTLSERSKGLFRNAVDTLLQFTNPSRVGQFTVSQVASAMDKIDLLHLASDALPHTLIPDVQPITIQSLCNELEQLSSLVAIGDIEPEVRRLVESSIQTLLMVLRGYKQFGAEGAARIFGSVAAELARVAAQGAPKTADGQSLFRKMMSVTKKIVAVVILAGATVHGADQFLTDGRDILKIIEGEAPSNEAAGTDSGVHSEIV